MKLRIKRNAIRIRIQQQELLDLFNKGAIEEIIVFGPEQTFKYRLEVSQDIEQAHAGFLNDCIAVLIPHQAVSEMVKTDRVGITSNVPIDNQETLSILVEKDFKCLTFRAEDTDAFPHPEAANGHS